MPCSVMVARVALTHKELVRTQPWHPTFAVQCDGRTLGFGPRGVGSIPSTATNFIDKSHDMWYNSANTRGQLGRYQALIL